MTHVTDMRGDLKLDSSEWLFKSPPAGGEDMLLAAPLQAAQFVKYASIIPAFYNMPVM